MARFKSRYLAVLGFFILFIVFLVWKLPVTKLEKQDFLGFSDFLQSCPNLTSLELHVSSFKSQKDTFLQPLSTVTKTLSNVNFTACPEHLTHVIREGVGLFETRTPNGQAVLSENGVMYIHSSNHTKAQENENNLSGFQAYVPYNNSLFFEEGINSPSGKLEKKIILWWDINRLRADVDQSLRKLWRCPDFPCTITTNRSYKAKSAAFVFDAKYLSKSPPENRRSDQILILYNIEPPSSFNLNSPANESTWRDVFNWTMTYKLDSDVFLPYGIVRKRTEPVRRNYYETMSKKKKFAAWMVSNCHTDSYRENYVADMQGYIPIDVFGRCGDKKCLLEEDEDCLKLIGSEYKFYLAFESAFCQDYITEKFYRYLSSDALIVARGSNDYAKFVPREIFINAAEYKSPKDLAEYLIYLDQNDEAYIQFLREKDKYFVVTEPYPIPAKNGLLYNMEYRYEAVPFCQVCQRMWNLEKYRGIVHDPYKWLIEEDCKKRDITGRFYSSFRSNSFPLSRPTDIEMKIKLNKLNRVGQSMKLPGLKNSTFLKRKKSKICFDLPCVR